MKRTLLSAALMLSLTGLAASLPAQAADPVDPRNPAPEYVAPINPASGETAFDFELKGYVLGLRLIRARYKGTFGNGEYNLYSDMKTSGIAALLKKQRLWSYTEGHYDETDLKPDSHIQQNMNKKSRRIEVSYDYETERVSQSAVPRIGSMGQPPATPLQAFSSDDVNSALLKIVMTGHGQQGEICKDNIPVYDSKQHYVIRMRRDKEGTRKFDGKRYPSVKCYAYLTPVSGYDPEDLPSAEEIKKPVTVYFINRPEYGVYMPVEFSYKVGGFKAKVKVKDAKFKKG